MDFLSFVRNVEARFRDPLPGLPAQIKMSSLTRILRLMNLFQANNVIQSSVLLLLFPFKDEVGLVLTQRKEYEGVHSGQISFPGGKFEENDDSLIFTALREAQEEIAINPKQVQVLGQLTALYIPPSNFLVTPVVGFVPFHPEFIAEPHEVAKVIEIRISDLLDDQRIQQKKIRLKVGLSLKVPCFVIDGNVIWGATAMILSEFREMIKTIPAFWDKRNNG